MYFSSSFVGFFVRSHCSFLFHTELTSSFFVLRVEADAMELLTFSAILFAQQTTPNIPCFDWSSVVGREDVGHADEALIYEVRPGSLQFILGPQ